MRKRAAIGILLFLIVACVGLALFPSRPAVGLQDLLLQDPGFPSRWNSKLGPTHVTWQSIPSSEEMDPSLYFYADGNAIRIWSDHGERLSAIYVDQKVYSYRTPIQAVLSYYVGMPEFWYGNKWPNFTFEDNASQRYPPDWSYESPFADQEHVVCAMGKLEACQLWYYWARYGQYLMQVEFFSHYQPIGPDLFQQIVSEIDTYVGKKLTP